MEMNELVKTPFSKWVTKDDIEHERTIGEEFSKEAFTSTLLRWVEHPDKLDRKLKMMVRYGISPTSRADLWRAGSGGAEKLQHNPRYYQEIITDIGIQIPSQLPDCMFNSEQSKPNFYLLSSAGEKVLLQILYTLTQIHPDIQFCPLLPPLAALYLHLMEEDAVFCCVTSMLESNRSFFDQSQRAVAVMAKIFQDCLKTFMKKAYKQLKLFISASTNNEVTKGTVLFPHWVTWLFKYLDFWTLIYTVDNFLIQGPKILVRVGLVIFNKFSKWLVLKQVQQGDMESLFSQFMSDSTLKGYKLLEAAFRIRGLSRKKLRTLKDKNLLLLKEGTLEIPFSNEAVKITTIFSIQGTDILHETQWEKLSSWLPEKIQIKHPFCLHTTQKDGCSIKTLYNKCENEAETLLLIKTSKGEIFGAYCTAPWAERCGGPKTLSYFGTGETFVFKLLPNAEKFTWAAAQDVGLESNDYFMAGDNTCLIIGGGGDNALWLDAELFHGHSGSSKTFNNEPLSSEQDFECARVEVLGFQD